MPVEMSLYEIKKLSDSRKNRVKKVQSNRHKSSSQCPILLTGSFKKRGRGGGLLWLVVGEGREKIEKLKYQRSKISENLVR